MSPKQRCKTFDDVLAALGGIEAVATLTKRGTPTIYKWRERGERFPKALVFVMTDALQRRGYSAPRELWGFEELHDRAA